MILDTVKRLFRKTRGTATPKYKGTPMPEIKPSPEVKPAVKKKGESLEYEAPIIGWTTVQLVCGECGEIMSFEKFDGNTSKYKHRCKCGNETFERVIYPFTRYQWRNEDLKVATEPIGK